MGESKHQLTASAFLLHYSLKAKDCTRGRRRRNLAFPQTRNPNVIL